MPASGAVDADCESDVDVEFVEFVPVLATVADFAEGAVRELDGVLGVGVRDARKACAEGVAAAMIELVGDEREGARRIRSACGAEAARDDH